MKAGIAILKIRVARRLKDAERRIIHGICNSTGGMSGLATGCFIPGVKNKAVLRLSSMVKTLVEKKQ